MSEKREFFYDKDGTKYIREDAAKKIYAPKRRMQFSQKV